jgi:hypothetical protein
MLIMAQNAQPFLGGVNFPNGHVLSAYPSLSQPTEAFLLRTYL